MLRSFDSALHLRGDGREADGLIFPFGEITRVRERLPDGTVDDYREEFLPGCTARIRQVAARRSGGTPSWIRLTLDHETGFDHRVGYCTELVEADDGAHATFSLYGEHLEKVRDMLAGSHKGLSIEFTDHIDPEVDGDLRRRRQIDISAVSATPIPMYQSARVLALRADESPLDDEATPNLDRVREMLAGIQGATP